MDTNHVKIGTVVSKHGYKGSIKINLLSSNLKGNLDVDFIFIDIYVNRQISNSCSKINDFIVVLFICDWLDSRL